MRTRRTSSLLLAPVALLATVGLVACGGSSPSSSASTVPAGLVVKAEEGIRLDQSTYTAKAGDVVVDYVNDSSLAHNLHFIDANGVDLPEVLEVTEHGQTAQKTVKLAAGTYTVRCKISGHDQMKATLTVTP
jgi:plastocyanin